MGNDIRTGTIPVSSAVRPGIDRPSALDLLPTTRRDILTHIKQHRESRAEDIAIALNITTSGVRQHLTGLAAAGLVSFHEVKQGPGRPKHLYTLTENAESLFPRRYGEFSNDVLLFLDEEDANLVRKLFSRRRAVRIEHAREFIADDSLEARVTGIAAYLASEGYVASAEPDGHGGWQLRENNCALLAVAQRHPTACASEIEFLRELLPDTHIVRTSHIVRGESACCYQISPTP